MFNIELILKNPVLVGLFTFITSQLIAYISYKVKKNRELNSTLEAFIVSCSTYKIGMIKNARNCEKASSNIGINSSTNFTFTYEPLYDPSHFYSIGYKEILKSINKALKFKSKKLKINSINRIFLIIKETHVLIELVPDELKKWQLKYNETIKLYNFTLDKYFDFMGNLKVKIENGEANYKEIEIFRFAQNLSLKSFIDRKTGSKSISHHNEVYIPLLNEINNKFSGQVELLPLVKILVDLNDCVKNQQHILATSKHFLDSVSLTTLANAKLLNVCLKFIKN